MYIHSVSMYVTEIRLFSSSFLSRHHQVSTARTRNSSSDPFLLVTGFLVFIQLLKQRMETVNGSLFSLSVGRWALTTWALSITVQMSATLLIAWRIWSAHRAVKNFCTDSKLVSVMWIIVESGMVLSSATVFITALYMMNVNAGGTVEAIIAQLDVRDTRTTLYYIILTLLSIRLSYQRRW